MSSIFHDLFVCFVLFVVEWIGIANKRITSGTKDRRNYLLNRNALVGAMCSRPWMLCVAIFRKFSFGKDFYKMTFNFLLLYSMTVFIVSIIPGPSMLLALTHGMKYGAKKTMASALGNVIVTLMQASVSIAGLGAVLAASETLFSLIKWAGAAYLIYTGLNIFFSSHSLVPQYGAEKTKRPETLKYMFLQASLVTAGNPKAIVFFTAIFPQFMDPDAAYLFQSCILLGLCAVIAFGCYMIYAISGQKVVSLFSNAAAGVFLKRAIGGSFIGAGIVMVAKNK